MLRSEFFSAKQIAFNLLVDCVPHSTMRLFAPSNPFSFCVGHSAVKSLAVRATTLLATSAIALASIVPVFADDSPEIKVTADNPSTIYAVAGQEVTVGFSAIVQREPDQHAECRITKGPTWIWSSTGASQGEATGVNGSGSVSATFYEAGTYTLAASAVASYETENCGNLSDEDSDSVTVIVEEKVWTKSTGITGGEAQAVTGGTTVAPGDRITLAVSAGSDVDHWKIGSGGTGKEGDSNDVVTYKWSTDGGSVSVPLPGYEADEDTMWTAPKQAGTYTVTCVIDDKAELPEGEKGSRDDEPKTVTFTLNVTRVWEAHTGIGFDQNGNPNGRVLPTQNTVVASGSSIGCQLEDATDYDKWTAGTKEGVESDEIHYTWQAPTGTSFVVALDGPFAMWQAPIVTTATDYTITCTIDDEPLQPTPGETGNRGDAALTRSLTVRVVPVSGLSRASLKLYKGGGTDGYGEEIADGAKVGGTIYTALEIEIGAHGRLKPGQRNVVVKYKDLWEDHKIGEGEGTQIFSFFDGENNAALWQKGQYHINNGVVVTDANNKPIIFWEGTGSPLTANDSELPIFYRSKLEWKTASGILSPTVFNPTAEKPVPDKLWSANGDHAIYVSKITGLPKADPDDPDQTNLLFEQQGINGFDTEHPYVSGPNALKADVQNLIITEVNAAGDNLDYFRFDSESTDSALTNPQLSFTIKDDGYKHRYRWYLWIKPTRSEPNSIEVTGILTQPGSKTVTLNLNDDAQQANGYRQDHLLKEWGAYTFDLRVQEIENGTEAGIGEPTVDFRSTKLFIPDHYTDASGAPRSGHDMQLLSSDVEDTLKVVISYYLEDSEGQPLEKAVDASNVGVDVLSGDQELLKSKDLSTEIRIGHDDVEAYAFTGDELGGKFRTIFVGEDSHAAEYRSHKNRRIMPVNQTKVMKNFHIEDDWMVSSTVGALNPQARDPRIWTAFARPEKTAKQLGLTIPWTPSKIVWGPINASHVKDTAKGHFSPGDTGPTTPPRNLRAGTYDGVELDSYSTDGFNPPGGVSRFQHYSDRDGPNDYNNGQEGGAAGYTIGHDKARYVHVVGASQALDRDENDSIKEGFYGLSSTGKDIRAWKRQRWSFVFIESIRKELKVSTVVQAKDSIVSTTIHEIGHQLGMEHDHSTDGIDDGVTYWSGIPGEEAAMDLIAAPRQDPDRAAKIARGLKELALYKGRLKPGVTIDYTKPIDQLKYRDCVSGSGLTTDYVFCEFHKNVVDTYTGW